MKRDDAAVVCSGYVEEDCEKRFLLGNGLSLL